MGLWKTPLLFFLFFFLKTSLKYLIFEIVHSMNVDDAGMMFMMNETPLPDARTIQIPVFMSQKIKLD